MLKRIFERLFGKKQDESVNQKEAAVCTLLCTEGEYKGQVFRLKDGDDPHSEGHSHVVQVLCSLHDSHLEPPSGLDVTHACYVPI